MHLISESVNKLLYSIYESKNPLYAELVVNWKKIIGDDLARQTKPLRVSRNIVAKKERFTLLLAVSNASLAVEINYQQDLIIERIAVYFGYKAIHKIKIMVQ